MECAYFFLNEGAGFSFFSWFACSTLLHCVTCEPRCLLPLLQFSLILGVWIAGEQNFWCIFLRPSEEAAGIHRAVAAAKFVNFSLAQFYHSAAHGKCTIIIYNAASVELKFSFLRKSRGWMRQGASMSRGQLLRLALGPAVPFFSCCHVSWMGVILFFLVLVQFWSWIYCHRGRPSLLPRRHNFLLVRILQVRISFSHWLLSNLYALRLLVLMNSIHLGEIQF